MASISDTGNASVILSSDKPSDSSNDLNSGMTEILKEILKEIKRNGDDMKANMENIGSALSDIRTFLKESKGNKVDADAQTDAPKLESNLNDTQDQAVEFDNAYKDTPSRFNKHGVAIIEPPSRFDMTPNDISKSIHAFITLVGTIDKELEKFVTGIRHIESSKWMIDDITNFRPCLRALVLLYVVHLVPVRNYKEWAEEQEWYKIDYFKTQVKDILLKDWLEYTKEEDELTDLNVYDIIVNFAPSAIRLRKTMHLFLEFTAKAADVKLVCALLESVSRLADTSEYYMSSFRQPYFESKFELISLYKATYQDLDVSIYSNMYLHKVLDEIAPSLIIFSTSLVDFNGLKNGALMTLKPYQDEAKSNI